MQISCWFGSVVSPLRKEMCWMNGVDLDDKGEVGWREEPTDDSECKLTFKGKLCAGRTHILR